jgi:outer membrane protein assembly factor BamB
MRTPRVFAFVSVLALIQAVQANHGFADWTQWRGANRDGHTKKFRPPTEWPKNLRTVWSVDVGEGHASPIIDPSGERIYVFSRFQDRETLTCVDANGKVAWRSHYDAPYKVDPAAEGHGKGPKATPLLQGDGIFTFGINGTLTAWERFRQKQLWQKSFADDFPKTSPQFGAAASPLFLRQTSGNNGQVIVHVGGKDRGALTSFDPYQGNVLWQWKGDGPGYASPILAKLPNSADSKPQIITQTQKQCVAVSTDGKLLWSIPYETAYEQNSVCPVVHGEHLILSGYQRGVTAYRFLQADGELKPDEAWHTDEASFYMSTPVVAGDRLYGFSEKNKGQLVCLNPADGKVLWQGPPRQGDNAALVVAGEILALLTTNSELVFVDLSRDEADRKPTYRELARYRVSETPTWTHPLLFGNKVLIKDFDKLTLLSFDGER